MLWIDTKYVNLISHRLDRFKQVDKNLFNCRCPFCGDSQKNKQKARGYFYTKNKNTLLYHCHNCGITRSVKSFLKQFDQPLHDEYSKEVLKEGLSFLRPKPIVGINAKEKDITIPGPPKFISGTPLQQLKRISQLNYDHPAKVYCEKRNYNFFIGEIEVNQELYEKVMGYNPSRFHYLPTSLRHPVECVSWYDAIVFCNKLSILCGLTKYYTIRDENNEIVNEIEKDEYKVEINENSKGYRLPFDEEWCYAAREYADGKELS